jgi:phage terminase small subunit
MDDPEIPAEVELAVREAVNEEESKRSKWREEKRARAERIKAERTAQGQLFEEGLRPRQARFVHLVSLGLPTGQAYIEAGYLRKDGKIPDAREAMHHGCRLLAEPKVKAYLSHLRETAFLANVLSLAEKRSFLADIVRTPIGKVDINDKLAQGVRYRDGEMQELKMPDKISALKLDAQLAGELVEKSTQVNVGLQLVNTRLESLDLPKTLDD